MNVGPTKPIRKLTEAERKALLSPDTPPSTAGTPPHKLYLETSFTNLNPDPDGSNEVVALHHLSGGNFSGSDPSLSWDYNQGAEAKLPRAERDNKSKSLPVKQRPGKLDLNGDDWTGLAPLATPETLSDSSSLDSISSKGSKKHSNGYQRLTQGVDRMEPIQQSPLRHLRFEKGNRYPVPPPSPDYAENNLKDYRKAVGEPLAQSTPMKNTFTTQATVEAQTPPKPPRLGLPNTRIRKENGAIRSGGGAGGKIGQDEYDDEEPLLNKLTSTQEGGGKEKYRLTFEDDLPSLQDTNGIGSEPNGEDIYERHSPNSPDSGVNQIEYGPGAYYSHGGRGYPHGGYMPTLEHSESDTDMLRLANEVAMYRSPEKRNLAQMRDNSAVFLENPHERTRHYSSPDTSQCSQMSSPDDEYGKRLSIPHSDEVFSDEIAGPEQLGILEEDV